MMSRSYKRPTKAEAQRMARLKEMPCVACKKHKAAFVMSNTEVHHLLSGNKRRGHQATIPLCAFHHRGACPYGWSIKDTEEMFGPSLALSSKRFHAAFGTDDELLAATNELLDSHHG